MMLENSSEPQCLAPNQ